MQEFESPLIESAEEYAYNYIVKKAKEAASEVFLNKSKNLDEILDKVRLAQSWVDFIAKGNDELMEDYSFHVFLRGGDLTIVQGKEMDYE